MLSIGIEHGRRCIEQRAGSLPKRSQTWRGSSPKAGDTLASLFTPLPVIDEDVLAGNIRRVRNSMDTHDPRSGLGAGSCRSKRHQLAMVFYRDGIVTRVEAVKARGMVW